MSAILQLTRRLEVPPSVPEIGGIRVRHFEGPEDIAVWLDIRRRAFARQRIGVGDWDARDFAREFLEKPWWRHERMWFAEARRLPLTPFQPVGTITLARRGSPPADKPAIHWLAVVPGYRRRGIGRLLVSTVESVVWNAGERQIWLETHSGWEEAARLYGALGYGADAALEYLEPRMRQVNYFLIEAALAPLTIENARLNGELNINPDDEGRLRRLFQDLVCPYVANWSKKCRDRLRLSLAYYLNSSETLDRVLASQQDLDMPEPTDVVQFFTILWKTLFPGEEVSSIDLTDVEERNEVMEINSTHGD